MLYKLTLTPTLRVDTQTPFPAHSSIQNTHYILDKHPKFDRGKEISC